MKTLKIKIPKEQSDIVRKVVLDRKRLRIHNICTLEIRKVKARKLFNNFSNKVITIPAHYRIHFVPSLSIKKLLK